MNNAKLSKEDRKEINDFLDAAYPNQHCNHEFSEGICIWCNTEYGGPKGPPFNLFHRILFRLNSGVSYEKIRFLSKNEQIKEMRRLENTAHKRQAAKLRYQRRQQWLRHGSLVGVFSIGLTIVLFWGLLITYSLLHPTPTQAQTHSTSGIPDQRWSTKCNPTIPGNHCKDQKHFKATCRDTGKMDGPIGCQDPSFFQGEGRESLLNELDSDGNPIYSVCHPVIKCSKLK